MSNLRLPTSGDENWGSILNNYLTNLDNKIQSLEKQYITLENNSAVKNIGYASSGVVGKSSCIYDTNTGKISFKGNVFISGDINTYFNNVESSKSLAGLAKDTSYYIFLKYSGAESAFDILEVSESLQLNYTVILLGVYYNNYFVPYYHSSLKTIMQIHDEFANCRIDLESNNSYFMVEIDNNKLPTNIECGKYDFYCGGFGVDSISKFYSSDLYKLTITPNGNVTYLYDAKTDNRIETFIGKTATARGNYYRILLDIFGNIFVQKAYLDYSFEGNGYWREQQLLNARFNNSLPINYNANFWVEVARFGYNEQDIEAGSYYQNSELNTDEKNTYEGMVFVKSIKNNWSAQQSPRIWVTKDSEISLINTTFIPNQTSNQGFKLEYSGQSTSNSDTLILDYASAESNKLLFAKSSEDVEFGNATIKGNLTIDDGKQIQFTSDRRRKDNFSTIKDSYLDIVKQIPVLKYTYKNSSIPQVGIIAQDLETTNISDISCFVNIQETSEFKDKRSLYETKLVYILWKALQEESELRKKLEQRVADLEAK